MINAEKYRNEILAMIEKGERLALRANNPTVVESCNNSIMCDNCLFNDGICHFSRMKWLLSEYKEPIKLTRLEYEILKYVQKEGINFIARTNYGNLCISEIKPIKSDKGIDWIINGKGHMLYAFRDLFQFVQWEDKKATSIKDVLNNCIVENIEEEQ